MLLHGTPVPPEKMGAAIWANIAKTMSDTTGTIIPHSDIPVVSASNTLWFPILKALSDGRRPELAAYTFSFSAARQVDGSGTTRHFVNEAVLQAVRDEQLCAHVYGVHAVPGSAEAFAPRADLDEWRIPEPAVVWDWAARVELADLSDEILVMRAEDDAVWPFLHGAVRRMRGEPAELAQVIGGVSIMPFGKWRAEEL